MFLRRFGVFAMIFAPVVNVGIGPWGDTLGLTCILLIAGFALHAVTNRTFTLHVEARHLMLIVALSIVYALVTGALIGEGEALQLVIRPVRTLVTFFGLYVFVQIYAKRFGSGFDTLLVHDVFIALGAHGVLMIAQFLFPSVRDAIYPYTFADQVIEWNQSFRMAGVTAGGSSQLSVYQSVGLLLYPFVLAGQSGFRKRLVSHVLALCIALSLILSGRSGIICAILFMPLALYWASHGKGFTGLVATFAKVAVVFLVVGAGIGALRSWDGLDPDQTRMFDFAVTRGVDFLFSSESASRQADVQEELLSFIIVPDEPLTLLFGDPPLFEAAYLMQNRIVNTDLGYIIFLYGYGIVGSLLQYSFYGLILLYAIRYWRYSKPLAATSVLMVFVIMLFHGKEVFVFTRIGLSLTTLFIVALFCAKRFKSGSTAAAGAAA